MIVTDGTHLLVSRKEGEPCGILFSRCTVDGKPILALAVDENSFKLGQYLTNGNYEDTDLDTEKFSMAVSSVDLSSAVMVALIPEDTAYAMYGPVRSGGDHNGIGSMVFNNHSVCVVKNNGSFTVTEGRLSSLSEVIKTYIAHASTDSQIPKTYDLFNASTGELIENASIPNMPLQRDTRPMRPYDEQYETKACNDKEIKSLKFINPRDMDFKFAEDEDIRGVAFVIHANEGPHEGLKGVYFGKGPVTHELMRQWASGQGKYVPGPKRMEDPNYTFGFYTNKGHFFTRRDTIWLVEENGIKLAIPMSQVNYRDGLLSTDIWENAHSRR